MIVGLLLHMTLNLSLRSFVFIPSVFSIGPSVIVIKTCLFLYSTETMKEDKVNSCLALCFPPFQPLG